MNGDQRLENNKAAAAMRTSRRACSGTESVKRCLEQKNMPTLMPTFALSREQVLHPNLERVKLRRVERGEEPGYIVSARVCVAGTDSSLDITSHAGRHKGT